MSALCPKPLSTRGLVRALRGLPRQRRGTCGPLRALAKKPVIGSTCHLQPLGLGGQRGFWNWGKSDDGENGNTNSADKTGTSDGKAIVEEEVSSSPSPGQGEASEVSQATEKTAVGVAVAQAAGAADSGLVPLKAARDALLKETGGATFEPRMLALPLQQRPLIPGQHQMVQITHPQVIEEVMKQFNSGSSPVFVATFLKREALADEVQEENAATHVEDLSAVDPLQALYVTGTRARIVQAAPTPAQAPPLRGPLRPAQSDDQEKGDEPATLQVLLHGRDLVRMDKVLDAGPPLQVQVSKIISQKAPEGPVADEIKAYINETMHTVREIMKINPQFREHAALIHQGMQRMEHGDPHAIAHFAACLTTAAGPELMQVLEAEEPSEKLRAVLTLVKKELELSQLQQKLTTQIQDKVNSHQREFMLREQLKMIKKELGEDKSDGSDLLLNKFSKQLEGKTVPTDAKEAIDSEMQKLSGLSKESQEYQITRNYLDWLTVLPWGVHSKDTLSLRKARGILDQDHHGLADVKQRILELIAVGTLRGSVQGKIICFVGPPGVGKTSIGKSIAQALGREFYRFSVGGLYDVAEIKGHRRTYVGAMPGKIVQCLKKTQSANPLVLIDEVDKIGKGNQGDPSSALLELLDPSQNSGFLDHYLDVPVDASKILFVCTANVTDTIPGPLLDRMEVIRLSGYDHSEKLQIAEDYLIPNCMREMGLWAPVATPADASAKNSQSDLLSELSAAEAEDVKIRMLHRNILDDTAAPTRLETAGSESDKAACESSETLAASSVSFPDARIEQGAVESLIRWYCREAGVRNLQKHVEKICRKLAMRVVERREAAEEPKEGEPKKEGADETAEAELVVTEKSLSDLVGKPPFTSDRLYEGSLPAGTVTGLAWTAMGGAMLYMEATALPRLQEKAAPPSLGVTGQLGSVMKESSQLALLLARRQLAALAPPGDRRRDFYEKHEIHLHCPEGATPKDGPSAGITITTALLSLALDLPVRADLAMTGEVSLNGKVLAIGGVKEKTIAARRAGCKALIFPHANRRDFDELPDYIKEGLEVHYATDYSDVFPVAFPDYIASESQPLLHPFFAASEPQPLSHSL